MVFEIPGGLECASAPDAERRRLEHRHPSGIRRRSRLGADDPKRRRPPWAALPHGHSASEPWNSVQSPTRPRTSVSRTARAHGATEDRFSLWSADEIASFGGRGGPSRSDSGRWLSPVSSTGSRQQGSLWTSWRPSQAREVRARIIAPAGSGKTRVLTERARYLLRAGVPASAMLLVAFNRRAQEEIVERTPDLPASRCRR